MTQSVEIVRPDDWHLHLRDGALLAGVLAETARVFGRAIVMPNLKPPVRTAADAAAYGARIRAALPAGVGFKPLMTVYLTDTTDPSDIKKGAGEGTVTAVKLYPAGATTNSEFGVTAIEKVYPVLEVMAEIGLPLLIHGEVTDEAVDIFDREAVFIERILTPLTARFPALKIVLEHVTTADAVAFVSGAGANVAATITPHHLVINRTDLFKGGIRPHLYCLPIAKRERHRLALRKAAVSGDASFFLGTDSAPHPRPDKESACGCAGIFCAPSALEVYAQVFEEEGSLGTLEAFASLNGPRFYGLPANTDKVTLEKADWTVPEMTAWEGGAVVNFLGGTALRWRLAA